ncbi:rhodoquinone biosynthesis methyltransferase RquA [Niveibacterium sp. SC-1]|uniref:rhodoquinone biosynthesis methyltransferase RquA n=1 Tax=Niveibacterium sp. SC-1 TaxID=3135646 RepID=UPI00311F8EF8
MSETAYEPAAKVAAQPPAEREPLPAYMTDVYDWAYVAPRNVRLLDRNLVVRTLLFGNDQRLMRAYLDEIEPGTRVWQVAHVYGDLVARAADKVGPEGQFDLTDVTPIQAEHGRRKLRDRAWARALIADAGQFDSGKPYDLCCSFFLLHEVPESKKRAVVKRVLANVAPGGKAVFVDYHRPARWQPIGWLLYFVNAKLEPFAHALWKNEIQSYAPRAAERFTWHKRTYFGGVYQVVIAQAKD